VAALFVAAVGVMTLTGASGLELLTILALTSPPAVTWSRRHLPALFPFPVRRPAPVEPRGGFQDREHPRSPFQARRPQDGAKPEPVEASPAPLLALQSPESMITDQLCLAWRRSFSVLHRAATLDELVVVTAARAGHLDELERRHEAGFSVWMANGPRPGSDPARYLPGPPHDPRPKTTTRHQPAPGTDVPDLPQDGSGVGRPDPEEG